MKPFNFSLQKLITIRDINEQEQQSKLAQLQLERSRIMHLVHRLEQQISVQENLLGQKGLGLEAQLRLQNELYRLEHVKQIELKRIHKDLQNVESRISEQRQKLMEATREKKAVEKMKEKAFERYQLDARREENLVNDDINQNIFSWRKQRALDS